MIAAGHTVLIQSPEAFTNAYSVCAIVLGQRIAKTAPPHPLNVDIRSVVRHMDRMVGPMSEAKVAIDYVCGESRRREVFVILGCVRAAGVAFSSKPRDDGSYEAEKDSIAVGIDYVEIISGEYSR